MFTWNTIVLDTLDLILTFIAGVGAFILFIIGLKRYKKDQIWKRSEFVAKEIQEFTSDKMVRNTMFMLDWGHRKIELFPDKPVYEDRFAKVDRQILNSALEFHELRNKIPGQERFTEVETAIRDNFDQFLSYFEKFEQFIVAKLITKSEISPYLDYWITAIADKMEKTTREVLYNFINEYNYHGTQNLFKRFGKNIMPGIESKTLVKTPELTE